MQTEPKKSQRLQAKIAGHTLIKHSSPLSRAHMLIVTAVFALIGGYLLYHSFATSPLVASIEAEQMSLPAGTSIITDSGASGGKAIKLSANGTASGTVSFPSSVTSLSIVAKGDACNGSPAMSVSLDGTNYLSNTSVSSSSWSSYTATPANAVASGIHTLSVSFTNDYTNPGHGKKGNGACSRNLYIDVTNFYGPAPAPTPAPTVTLSVSPSSVTAGSSATLTWNSTNASSCNASGAWNITGLAPSGSQSTGALNQTSTYSLTCSGDGGSASASAKVTVTTGFSTSLTQGMTITPPYTWTFNPGVASVKGYFWADGQLLAAAAPNANGSYSFTIQSSTLTAGTHLLGHAWDLPDGTHQTGPANYSVTIASSGGTTTSNLGSKLPARLPQSSGSKVIYASPSGSGTSCSSTSPCSFNQAWTSAASGTIINLKGGNYSGALSVQSRHYSATNPVTIQSNPGETATFTGCTASCSSNILYFADDVGIRIRNIALTGTNSHGSAIKIDSSAHIDIDGVTFHELYQNGILVVGNTSSGWLSTYSSDIQIWNSTFYRTSLLGGENTSNQADGIYIGSGAYYDGTKHGVDGYVIANNVFYDQPNGYEIQAGNEASNGFIVNNTFDHAYGTVGDGGSAIVVWGKGDYPTQNVVITNNIFSTNLNHAVQSNCSSALSGINLSGNLGYSNGSPEYYNFYGSTACFTPGTNFGDANPLYMNRTSHDFHLQSGSPALGKADPDYTPQFDHDGNARTSTPNLGAY